MSDPLEEQRIRDAENQRKVDAYLRSKAKRGGTDSAVQSTAASVCSSVGVRPYVPPSVQGAVPTTSSPIHQPSDRRGTHATLAPHRQTISEHSTPHPSPVLPPASAPVSRPQQQATSPAAAAVSSSTPASPQSFSIAEAARLAGTSEAEALSSLSLQTTLARIDAAERSSFAHAVALAARLDALSARVEEVNTSVHAKLDTIIAALSRGGFLPGGTPDGSPHLAGPAPMSSWDALEAAAEGMGTLRP